MLRLAYIIRFNMFAIINVSFKLCIGIGRYYLALKRTYKKVYDFMKKYLILTNAAKSDPFLSEWSNNGLQVAIIFKDCSKPMRFVRKIWIKYGLPFHQIWYGDIKNKVCNADIIIVHMSYLTLRLCEYINKCNPNAKVIAWWWNKIIDSEKPSLQKGKYDAWSFDICDCERYNLKFNHQYYFKSFIIPNQKKEWDIYFCGSDSGRGNEIVRLYNVSKKMGLTVKFQVVFPQSRIVPNEIVSEYVDYKEIRQNISKSNAVLEIVRDGQSGPTLRMMEAIYFQKKLITNNTAIKDEEFYDESRIFLYTERPISELRDFLNGNFVPYEDNLIDKYDVKQWIENFTKDKK